MGNQKKRRTTMFKRVLTGMIAAGTVAMGVGSADAGGVVFRYQGKGPVNFAAAETPTEPIPMKTIARFKFSDGLTLECEWTRQSEALRQQWTGIWNQRVGVEYATYWDADGTVAHIGTGSSSIVDIAYSGSNEYWTVGGCSPLTGTAAVRVSGTARWPEDGFPSYYLTDWSTREVPM
jgi:hypothetical protein